VTARLLEVRGLKTHLRTADGLVRAVDGVSFAVDAGRTVGIVGESGCGKSVTALSIMGLVPSPPAVRAGGEILFEGRDLLTLGLREMQDLRGDRIAMIFQEPMTSLNPAFTVGDQIGEAIRRHRGVSAAEARAQAVELMRRVGIPSPERRADDHPHRLSGGMRQRVMIAMALACRPRLLIADEPTTALDVTIQVQIIDLLRELRGQDGMGIVLITHDLGVVAELCDEVVVMYAGRVVERAPAGDLFERPHHPYTVGLLGSVPTAEEGEERLAAIDGMVPSALDYPAGCRFAARCPFAEAACLDEDPPLREVEPGRFAACRRAPLEAAA
jgi:oligopeptide/dipeptide ABC transporter ATP-binding protein